MGERGGSRVSTRAVNARRLSLPLLVERARRDVCQIDLRRGPGVVSGTLPQAFWSVAVYSHAGVVLYSTTNRDSVGLNLDLGIFNQAQTRLLAEQKLDVAEGLLIVESRDDDVYIVVRLAPAHQVMRARYEAQLQTLRCGNIPT